MTYFDCIFRVSTFLYVVSFNFFLIRLSMVPMPRDIERGGGIELVIVILAGCRYYKGAVDFDKV